MLQSFIASGLAFALVLSTGCTIKGSGSARERYESATAGAEGSPESGDQAPEEETPACLKLAEKRQKNLMLMQEGEEPEPETGDETAACPDDAGTGEELPPDESTGEEIPPEE